MANRQSIQPQTEHTGSRLEIKMSRQAARPSGARPYPGSVTPIMTGNTSAASVSARTGSPSSPAPQPEATAGNAADSRAGDTKHIWANTRSPFAAARLSRAGASRHSVPSFSTNHDYFSSRSESAHASLTASPDVLDSPTHGTISKDRTFSLRSGGKRNSSCVSSENKENATADNIDEERLHNAALNEAAELVWQHQNGYKLPQPGAPYRYQSHLRSAQSLPGNILTELPSPQAKPSSPKEPAAVSDIHIDAPRPSLGSMRAATAIKHPTRSWSESPVGRTPARRPLPWLSNRYKTEVTKSFSQALDPSYKINSPINRSIVDNANIVRKNGMEVRSEDIINATSRKLKDRSEKLPTPTIVSDSPGRPIVSFSTAWKEPETKTLAKESGSPRTHALLAENGQKQAVGRELPNPGNASSSNPTTRAISPSSGPSVVPVVEPGTRSTSVEATPARSPRIPPFPSVEVVPDIEFAKPVPAPPLSANHTAKKSTTSRAMPFVNIPAPRSTESKAAQSTVPSISVSCDDPPISQPSIPTISVSCDDVPSPRPSMPTVPSIVEPPSESKRGASLAGTPGGRRPLPVPGRAGMPVGAQLRQSQMPPTVPAPGARATATCHECFRPIEGRFVALKGAAERFHPQCFRCFACGTSLEALEISPEPEDKRAERLERIRRRGQGEILPEEEGKTAAEDGDGRLRFFCHLDWHELFAPRCKYCTTPILGDHVVALGQHWHHGHFFCAECGDPFEQGATHIEKDGHAWCVNCQTKRTERRAPKCRKCRKPVIGQYIVALGGEWHDECFKCATCQGAFSDGQVFPKDAGDMSIVLCTKCRQAELKA